jgi:SAM-dependent methyltransferase
MTDKPQLDFTGERFTPECVREIAYEHWHRYAWASRRVAGLQVLDAACGEGYGSFLLGRSAREVIGIDIDPQSIDHARKRYAGTTVRFECGDCTRLPLDADSVDAVVSFETLEHLEAQDQLLAEFRRVLRPDGFLLLSSPDRQTYSDDTGYNNPFHVRELYRDEFESLLGRHFPAWQLFGQKLMFVSAVWRLDNAGATDWLTSTANDVVASDQPILKPLYFLAAAAAAPGLLPSGREVSLYGDREESVYQHYNDEIRKHIRAGELLAERDAEIAELKARLARGS